MTTPRKIRWLIAHQPQELFLRTANAFAQELNKLCPGEIEVEILTYPEYKEKYKAIPGLERDPAKKERFSDIADGFWQALSDCDIEISQVQTTAIGSQYSDFWALDLPYLFDDHDHATRVLEGDIGQELCENLGKNANFRGLAFTYSGGFRVIGSEDPITDLADLQGRRIMTANPLTLAKTIESMGGDPVVVSPSLWDEFDPVGVDAVETTYLRFQGSHILKTNHSMFLTTILASNKFWESLSEAQQTAFKQAAFVAAKLERQWSIDDAEQYEVDAEAKGVSIVELSEEDQARLKQKSQLTYLQTKYLFSPDLVRRIRTLH